MHDAKDFLRICSVAVALCLLAPTPPAQAEFVAEFYGGGAFTNSADVDVTSSLGGSGFTLQGVTFKTSWTAGGRAGYWFKEVGELGAFGMGLDVFSFKPVAERQSVQLSIGGSTLGPFQIGSIEISTVAIGFDVLRFRLHLAKSEEFQQGRIQPYVSAGPTLFITKTSDENIFPSNQSSTKTSVGVKAGAGLNVHLTPAWSLFGEYRFTHFTSKGTFHSAPPFAASEITTTIDLNTHHLVGGISIHF